MAGLSTPEFVRLIKPLDEFSEHRLHADAIERVYRIYRDAGPEAAERAVRVIREAFRDVRNDSYLTTEVAV